MIKKMDNPYAFPCLADAGQWGMELRDYFAAAALQGLLANPELFHGKNDPASYKWNTLDEKLDIVSEAYEWADAMLEVRKS